MFTPLPGLGRYCTGLLAGLSTLLVSGTCQGQVQSNAGYSQSVVPSTVTAASRQLVVPRADSAQDKQALKRQYEAAEHKTSYRFSRVADVRVRKYGVLTDGDFSKAVGKDGVAPTTGSIGLNYAVFLPVVYGKKYLTPPPGSAAPTQELFREEEPEQLVPWLTLNVLFSLGGRGDTLLVKPDSLNPARPLNQRDFGQSLLLPGSNSSSNLRSVTLSGRWYPASWWVKYRWFKPAIIGADLSAATARWGYANRRMNEFTIISGSIRGFYTLFDVPAKDDDDFSLHVDAFAGLSGRFLRGDIREEASLLTQALGTTDKYSFVGYDLGIQASVNALRLTATYSTFGSHIKGFSGGQFVFGVGFSSAFRFTKTTRS